MKKWKAKLRKSLAVSLAAAVVCSCLNVTAFPVFARENTDGAQEEMPVTEEEVTFTVPVSEDAIPDSDELFAGYVEKVLYEGMNDGISSFGVVGEERLQGDCNKKLYAVLKEKIKEIAAGRITNTRISLDLREIGITTFAEVQTAIDTNSVLSYLLADCPYEFYWFDKTAGMSIGYDSRLQGTFSFTVAKEYQGGDQYTVSSDVSKVQAAAQTARQIVKDNENKSDYEKLSAYREQICGLVSYNTAAAATATAYGNPWQMIWVFDNDPTTNVVCEGYAKAFQYLCDLSDFINASCYTVTGVMSGGTGSGPHMWNIVTLDGENYLVDITNCDTGSAGAPDQLFLAGASGSVSNGYMVNCRNQQIAYRYDSNQSVLYGNVVLTLAGSKYIPKLAPTVSVSQNGTITYGDPVNAKHIKGSAEIDGEEVAGTFSWASDVTAYGDAGTKTLRAVFTPDDTGVYDRTAATIAVTVMPKPITVQADMAAKSYGAADPVWTYTVSGLIAGDSLTGALTRIPGESVKADGYQIRQGTLTNPNYKIDFRPSVLMITPADYEIKATASQNLQPGSGEFVQPVFTGVKNEEVKGALTYTFDHRAMTYEELKAALSGLTSKDRAVTVEYSFATSDPNYMNSPKTGMITFTVGQNWNVGGDHGSSGAAAGVLDHTGDDADASVYGTRMLNVDPTAFNTMLISWDAVPEAKSYEIFYSTSPDSGFKRLTKVKKPFYKFSKAKCGVTYYFRMRVCQKDTQSEFGPVSYGRTELTGTSVLQVKKTSYNSITLKWSKVAGAKKYEILCADSIGGEWSSLGVKSGTSFTHKKLVTGATYYYQIRPVRDSFYGSYSNGISAATTFSSVSRLKVKAAGTDQMQVSWKKVQGADQYVVLRSESIDGEYEIVARLNRTSYTDTGLTSGVTCFYKIYAISGPYRTRETDAVGQTTKLSK